MCDQLHVEMKLCDRKIILSERPELIGGNFPKEINKRLHKGKKIPQVSLKGSVSELVQHQDGS